MLTFILIGFAAIVVVIALIAFSSRAHKRKSEQANEVKPGRKPLGMQT